MLWNHADELVLAHPVRAEARPVLAGRQLRLGIGREEEQDLVPHLEERLLDQDRGRVGLEQNADVPERDRALLGRLHVHDEPGRIRGLALGLDIHDLPADDHRADPGGPLDVVLPPLHRRQAHARRRGAFLFVGGERGGDRDREEEGDEVHPGMLTDGTFLATIRPYLA